MSHRSPNLDRRTLLRTTALGLGGTALGRSRPAGAFQPPPPLPSAAPLRVGLAADPVGLDPHVQGLTASFRVTEQLYDTLVRLSPEGTVEPGLAESWTIAPDGLAYTFRLRPGVSFHSGRGLVASDVEYSLDRLKNPLTGSPNALLLAFVTAVDAPDDRTVELALKEPDASLLTNLTHPAAATVAREVIGEYGDLNRADIDAGTGPFVLRHYEPGVRAVLDRNPAYWDPGKPAAAGLELAFLPDDAARAAAVLGGAVDLIEAAPPADLAALGTAGFQLPGPAANNLRFLAVNLRQPPFADPRVRQAVAAALDRAAIVAAAVGGQGTPLAGFFPPGHWAHLDQPIPPPDPERARALLRDAGFGGGFATTIRTMAAYGALTAAAEAVRAQLEAVGIRAEVEAQETGVFMDGYLSGTFALALSGTSGYVDPNDLFARNFTTWETANPMGYENPDGCDRLVGEGMRATDPAARKAVYDELQRVLLADLPWVPLFAAAAHEALRPEVRGFAHSPTGSLASLRETHLG